MYLMLIVKFVEFSQQQQQKKCNPYHILFESDAKCTFWKIEPLPIATEAQQKIYKSLICEASETNLWATTFSPCLLKV